MLRVCRHLRTIHVLEGIDHHSIGGVVALWMLDRVVSFLHPAIWR